MSFSTSILQALSKLVKCEIEFVSIVNFKSVDYFFCIGRHSFFIITKELNSIEIEIYLAHLEKVIIDISKFNLLQMVFNDNRDGNIPGKMNVLCDDRSLLLNSLRCSWKTDYMFRLGKIKNLPVFKLCFI